MSRLNEEYMKEIIRTSFDDEEGKVRLYKFIQKILPYVINKRFNPIEYHFEGSEPYFTPNYRIAQNKELLEGLQEMSVEIVKKRDDWFIKNLSSRHPMLITNRFLRDVRHLLIVNLRLKKQKRVYLYQDVLHIILKELCIKHIIDRFNKLSRDNDMYSDLSHDSAELKGICIMKNIPFQETTRHQMKLNIIYNNTDRTNCVKDVISMGFENFSTKIIRSVCEKQGHQLVEFVGKKELKFGLINHIIEVLRQKIKSPKQIYVQLLLIANLCDIERSEENEVKRQKIT